MSTSTRTGAGTALPWKVPALLGLTALGLLGVTALWGWLAATTWVATAEQGWTAEVTAHRPAVLTSVLEPLTWLGDARAVSLATVALVAVLLRRRQLGPALLVAGSTWGVFALVVTAKAVVGRDRPPPVGRIVEAMGSSLPSGHSALVVAFFGSVAWTVAGILPPGWRRVGVWGVTALAALVVGYSRVYLGAHWPTDVLSGWTIGTGWLLSCVWALRPRFSQGRS